MDAKHLESRTQKVITEDRSFSWDDVSNEILRVVSRVHCEPVFSLTAGMTDVEYICHICTLGKNNHHRSSRLAEGLGVTADHGSTIHQQRQSLTKNVSISGCTSRMFVLRSPRDLSVPLGCAMEPQTIHEGSVGCLQ